MANPIRVVLQQDVDNLGAGGEVVKVRPGYARNFLIPRGLALPATVGNLARVEEFKKQAAVQAAELLKAAEDLKAKLEGTSVKLERAVGADAKMYGSVTTKDIEEAYGAQGLVIDRRKVELADPIKVLGLTEVKVKLHSQVSATLRVEVIKASS
ncbi:MAG TPA: 50S ribosomal protein L9 [Polyangiaceae bacterium]|nr:50S ribosomal protein L9 [Polyangiaceae bacterium]